MPTKQRTKSAAAVRRRQALLKGDHGQIKLLLTRTVEKLGQQGEIVQVRPGYARNYLLPQGLATYATEHNLRMVEKQKRRVRELEEARRADLQAFAAQLGRHEVHIEANATEEGHLYGSVTAVDIAAALQKDGLAVKEENIRLPGPLKELALYTVDVHLAEGIDTQIKVWVVPTGAMPAKG